MIMTLNWMFKYVTIKFLTENFKNLLVIRMNRNKMYFFQNFQLGCRGGGPDFYVLNYKNNFIDFK